MGWMASLFKFDHSAVDADGERLRVRETMHADSKVPAPGIWPTKEINKLIDAEIHQESPPDRRRHARAQTDGPFCCCSSTPGLFCDFAGGVGGCMHAPSQRQAKI